MTSWRHHGTRMHSLVLQLFPAQLTFINTRARREAKKTSVKAYYRDPPTPQPNVPDTSERRQLQRLNCLSACNHTLSALLPNMSVRDLSHWDCGQQLSAAVKQQRSGLIGCNLEAFIDPVCVELVRLLCKVVPPCGNVNICNLINASELKSFLCVIDVFILHIN